MDMLLSAIIVAVMLLSVGGLAATLIGVITIVQFVRAKKAPMDESNRINHIRLWWFALTRPELFVDRFPWLKNDELENFPDSK